MRKLFVFILTLTIILSAFAALTVLHADNIEADYYFDASAIKKANTWISNGSVTDAKNGDEDVVRYVPTSNGSNGFGITVDIPTQNANFIVVKYETNLFVNSFNIDYPMRSDFDFNYRYGLTRLNHDPDENIFIFNMTVAVKEAEKAGQTSINYVKFIPWNGQAMLFDGALSEQYFDLFSVAFFADYYSAEKHVKQLKNTYREYKDYSYVDYDKLPKSDALYLADDFNDSLAWMKNGYRAYLPDVLGNPFKYIPTANSSNGFGFKVDVPVSKAKYAVVRYYTTVTDNAFRIVYSHDNTFDYYKQYGVGSTSHGAEQRVAIFNMSSAVSATSKAGVSKIEYLKLLPWEGQAWTGTAADISDNYFNLYSVAFFANESDAQKYKAALEAALPSLDSDLIYDNSGALLLPSAPVDSTGLDNMVEAFKEKEKAFAALPNKLVIYPEYPERIGRDYDYSVTVTQGNETHSIPVYNELRQGGGTNTPYRDDHRRFCEFAFSGEPVRIDITVNMSFSEYTIIPAAKNIPSEVNGNVISVYVSEPMQLILRLGNGLESNNTNLAIFVDPPEENVPDKNDPNVIYIEGWYEEEDNELNVEEDGTTVYIAPGAVCNARIISIGKSDVTVTGRGMVRDPYDTRSNNIHAYNYNVNFAGGNNILVEGIKIVDCRFYHLYFGSVTNSEIYNVKIFSNQISTDGFPVTGTNIYMHDSYADVGDDVFTGTGTNKLCEDMLVGTTQGVFSFSGIKNNEVYRNIHIFRADGQIFRNFWGTGPLMGITLENIFAVDCPFTRTLFSSADQGEGQKNVIFKNVSINSPSGDVGKSSAFNSYADAIIKLEDKGPFYFEFENLYIDGKLISEDYEVGVKDYSVKGAYVNVTTNPDTQVGIPLKTNTTVLDTPYVAPAKVKKPLRKGENIAPNGDFEDGAAPWVCVDFSYIYLTDDAVSGKNSLYVPASQNSSGEDQRGGITGYITDDINRGGAGEYLIEFYAKKAPGFEGSDIAAVLGYYYGEITETTSMSYKSPSQRFTLTEEWQKYSFVATVEVDEVERAALSIHRGSGTTYAPLDFYLDGISITKLDASDIVYGDVNGDGEVNRKDLTRLAQYFARWEVEIDEAASDANGDGKVDRKDLTRLAQYFARWDVVLGK